MSGWTAERINQLAPDASSAKAGQGLAQARHWASQGTENDALWGECQGSGAKPYQVRIDLSEPAFKCSCPSRKFPCKHAIGLMLMFAAGTVTPALRPAWVEEWFAERTSRAEKKREKADTPPNAIDVQAQLKRKEERFERVGDGLAALKLWLHDLSRTGLASVPSRGYAFFDDQARRLIDAQAPGVARRVQTLAGIASSGAGWQRPFLEQLASIYLVIRGYERRGALPPAARDVLMSVIGIGRSQEEILALPPVADRWQIIAQEVLVEERLRAQHTWLLGTRTGQLAHVLAFAHGTQPFDAILPAGFNFDGEICFYPGENLRGLVKSSADLTPIATLTNGTDIDGLFDQYATRRAINPWLEGFAVAMSSVVPRRSDEQWSLVDTNGRSLPLAIVEAGGWKLLAVSGGHPIGVVVYFDGHRARPLAAFVAGEYLSVGGSRGEEAA